MCLISFANKNLYSEGKPAGEEAEEIEKEEVLKT